MLLNELYRKPQSLLEGNNNLRMFPKQLYDYIRVAYEVPLDSAKVMPYQFTGDGNDPAVERTKNLGDKREGFLIIEQISDIEWIIYRLTTGGTTYVSSGNATTHPGIIPYNMNIDDDTQSFQGDKMETSLSSVFQTPTKKWIVTWDVKLMKSKLDPRHERGKWYSGKRGLNIPGRTKIKGTAGGLEELPWADEQRLTKRAGQLKPRMANIIGRAINILKRQNGSVDQLEALRYMRMQFLENPADAWGKCISIIKRWLRKAIASSTNSDKLEPEALLNFENTLSTSIATTPLTPFEIDFLDMES